MKSLFLIHPQTMLHFIKQTPCQASAEIHLDSLKMLNIFHSLRRDWFIHYLLLYLAVSRQLIVKHGNNNLNGGN